MQTQPSSPSTQKRTVSVVLAIVLLIAGIAAGAGVTYFGIPRGTTGGICSSGRTLTIGELLDLSSDLKSQGVRAKASSTLAISDINAFLTSAGCTLRFTNSISDYGLDDSKAQTALSSFAASGVQVVVGPLNSGSAQYILSYADSNHIVLISPSSTSVALNITNDYLFRTAPNDRWQGRADARMFVDRGATALIIVQRHDSYGDALATATANRFRELGKTVIDIIQYDKATTDFTTILNTVQTDFNNNVGTYGANKIALDFISFEEFGTLILQAKNYGSFPWSTLPWFGVDGQAQDAVIVNATTSGPYLAQVTLPSTLYGYLNNSKTDALYRSFASANPGNICDAYCLGTYDDLWLAALATLQAGSYDGTAIQKILPTVAANYFGVTGPMLLESSGDRVATSYQIWKVVNQGTPIVPTWVYSGNYDPTTDVITWASPP